MKQLAFFLILATAVIAGFAASTREASALSGTVGTKNISITIVVTPSPIVYVPTTANGLAQERPLASPEQFDSMLAYNPVSMQDVVAQATPQSSVKVQFTVKPDPTYAYFHITPVSTNLNAGYGPNTWTCVYKVFGHYATSWSINDWNYGSSSTGGTSGFNGFPTYNYATTSLLSWLAETMTMSYAPFANGGAPGQTAFKGAAGSTEDICIDLSLNVPSTIPAGTYGATITYRMTHT